MQPFAGVARDPAPDATAARLRLSVAAFGTPAEELLAWAVEPELASYVATWRHVGAACRLPANEERELLDSCSADTLKSPLLANRASYLYLRSRVDERVAVGHPDAALAILDDDAILDGDATSIERAQSKQRSARGASTAGLRSWRSAARCSTGLRRV